MQATEHHKRTQNTNLTKKADVTVMFKQNIITKNTAQKQGLRGLQNKT